MVTSSLIFEILSNSTRKKDENLKFDLFEAIGVLYYCLVDPEKKSTKLYELENGHFINLRGSFLCSRLLVEVRNPTIFSPLLSDFVPQPDLLKR